VAAYIPVPRDLTKVKSKILFNLTKRQLVCFGAATLIGVPSFFLLRKLGNISLASMGMIVIMLPLFFLAMYEKDGQPLEVIARHFIETRFIRPKIRPYQTDNYYAILHRQTLAQKEVEKIVLHSQKTGKTKRKAPGKPDKKRKKTRTADHRSGKKK
jgi:hypothetical protein